MEEYSPCDPSLKPNIPVLMTQCIQIHLSGYIAQKWERGGVGGGFPDLEAIWRNMDLQEPWEPTFPPGYDEK